MTASIPTSVIGPQGTAFAMPDFVLPQVAKESVLWSNNLIDAPIAYSLMERRLLYLLTRIIKHRFTERNLGAPSTWSDLCFHLTDADLSVIGGRTNVVQTYKALADIHKKTVVMRGKNQKGERIVGHIHWVDTFYYNQDSNSYSVRVSPEVMPYLINLSANFTEFSTTTALKLSSKFSQKFYEICCRNVGDYQRKDKNGRLLKSNVVMVDVAALRHILAIDEQVDVRTGEVTRKGKYNDFWKLCDRVIKPAQMELHELFMTGCSDVWFDFAVAEREKRKVTSLFLFIYTKNSPKDGIPAPWHEGDEPLNPYAQAAPPEAAATQSTDVTDVWGELSTEQLEEVVAIKLGKYLAKEDAWKYIGKLRKLRGNRHTMCLQVLQVMKDKEQQPKFANGTTAYKRKAIKDFALAENLKEYGWSLS